MNGPCSDSFRALAETLGGISCETANAAVTLRSPFSLASWTMPIVEVVMIGGALLALAHAIRVRRSTGDPSNLALWCAAITFVFALEPPLYFPHQLGYGDRLDVIFVHNVFTVQFLYDRLPLYIIALYPAGIYLSYSLVARLGVFERRGRLVGAVCVGFIHHCFYEIFDHIGPQLRWWAWNPNVPLNAPALGSVPLVSVVIFGIVAPAILAFVWRLLVAEPVARGGLDAARVVARTVATGLVTPILLSLAGSPVSAMLLDENPSFAMAAAVLYAAVVVVAFVSLHALAAHEGAKPAATDDRFVARYALVHGAAYLVVFTILWLAAMPDWLGAVNGRTSDGAPIGSLLYASACAAVCGWGLWRNARADIGAIAPTSPALVTPGE